ncbi:MAG: succinyl-diaminopimelate desuccinylase [bacterium]
MTTTDPNAGASAEATTAAILELTCRLIERHSVTPADEGCQDIIGARLQALGFKLEQIDAHGVRNLWAVRGSGSPHLMFAGHTDVVPPGPLDQWHTPPFTPTVIHEVLYGRGAADMKTSLAAMVVAVENLLQQNQDLPGTLSFLITSDEEGDATFGTNYAIQALASRGIKPHYCIVGEPSSSNKVGDVVRCGRRGSLNGTLVVRGIQGHVAYPDDADNPIHKALGALAELTTTVWDKGNEYYPPTSFAISNISAGTGASNVIPGTLNVLFNFRFNTAQTSQGLQNAVAAILDKHKLNYELAWALSGEPFLTAPGALTRAVTAAVKAEMGFAPELSTSGGTSDGRFISPWGSPGSHSVEVVELGPCNGTIHKLNECIKVAEMRPLMAIYQRIITMLLKP